MSTVMEDKMWRYRLPGCAVEDATVCLPGVAQQAGKSFLEEVEA